ncbi:MAG: PHB depolymerase family esterase [Myxococcota bacterium]|nr:PHB depolymerase family esterase [Myxococcota bacterium]
MKTQSFIPLILSGVIGIACNQSTEESNAADEVEIQESDYDKDESDYDKDESDYDKDESEQEDDAGYEKDEDGESSEVCDNPAHEGYRTIVSDDATREYVLHVPASYDGTTPIPLMINFHGFGGCASQYADNVGDFYGLNALADSENFIVAYPQGVTRAKGAAEWDPGDSGTQDINENDLYFVEQLISGIGEELSIDSNRIYATGYSNGGMMVYGLACNGNPLIAAGGIMSGIMLGGECNPDVFTSLIHFHGIGDDALPYDGNQDFQPVLDVVDFWLSHNSIPSGNLETTSLNDGNVVRDLYTGGSGDSAFALYTVYTEHNKDGGHVWFSEDIDGSSPNQILWDFLSAYRLAD